MEQFEKTDCSVLFSEKQGSKMRKHWIQITGAAEKEQYFPLQNYMQMLSFMIETIDPQCRAFCVR